MKITLLGWQAKGRCQMTGKEGECVRAEMHAGAAPAWLGFKALAQAVRLASAAENGSGKPDLFTKSEALAGEQ